MDSPFAKLKVVELKEKLSAKGLSTKGLKKDLVERLEQANNASEHNAADDEQQDMEEAGELKSDIHLDSVVDDDIHETAKDSVTHDQVYPLDKNDTIELDYDEPTQTIEAETEVKAEQTLQPATPQPQIGTKFDSSIVKISNLVRPFSLEELQSLLSKYGLVITFWIDRLRTVAFAEFESVEAAELCKFQLDGLQWPQGVGKPLVVEPSNVDSMNAAMNAPVVPIVDNQNTHKTLISPPAPVSNNVLDQLFCKTKCLPHLYYLPKNKQ